MKEFKLFLLLGIHISSIFMNIALFNSSSHGQNLLKDNEHEMKELENLISILDSEIDDKNEIMENLNSQMEETAISHQGLSSKSDRENMDEGGRLFDSSKIYFVRKVE